MRRGCDQLSIPAKQVKNTVARGEGRQCLGLGDANTFLRTHTCALQCSKQGNPGLMPAPSVASLKALCQLVNFKVTWHSRPCLAGLKVEGF